MYSARGNAALPALGFPIRASADHGLFSASPRLIAAVHALLRLLVPRHPPCALLILTVIRPFPAPQADPVGPGDTRIAPARERTLMLALLCSFQGPWKGAGRTGRRSLKTQQHARHPPTRGARLRLGQVDMLGPGRSSCRVVRREGDPGAPILETSLERR